MDIKIGEYAKVKGENRVFEVHGFTKGRRSIPDGWFIDKDGCAVNPKFCDKHNGVVFGNCLTDY